MADKGINIKISEELYKEIKYRALELDKTLKDYIIDLIKKDLNKKIRTTALSQRLVILIKRRHYF